MNFSEKIFSSRNSENKLSIVLNNLSTNKKEYGIYNKTIIHFHTYASHDYGFMINGERISKNKEIITDDFLKDIAKKNGIYGFYGIDKKISKLLDRNVFESYKECISYLLIAQCLFTYQIAIAVVTDHNTIDGYQKLKCAVSVLKKYHKNSVIPFIQLGVEISCGDLLHVVGIIDNSEDSQIKIQSTLNDVLLSENKGSYLPSWQIIERLKSIDAIAYIAHINTSDIFDNYGSGAYKEKLFSKDIMRLIGVSNPEYVDYLLTRLKKDRKIDGVTILYDNDSHCLEDMGKNIMWIKGQKINFDLFKNAIRDSDVSIRYDSPTIPTTYIKGIYIKGNGFLGKSNNPIDINLSSSLNCIIGGRGTGKSTLMECVNFVLSQNVDNENRLRNICNQGLIILTISLNNNDYFIMFNPAINNVNDQLFIQGFLYGEEHQHDYGPNNMNFNDNIEEIKRKSLDKIQIFRLDDKNIYEIKRKKQFFNHIFSESYSINDLVKTASDNKIQNFIEDQLSFSQNPIPKLKKVKISNDAELKKHLNHLPSKMSEHKQKVLRSIELMNKDKSNITIKYAQLQFHDFKFNFKSIVYNQSRLINKKIIKKYDIYIEEILDFLDESQNEFSVISFYFMFKNHDYTNLAFILNKYIDNERNITHNKKVLNQDELINIVRIIDEIIIDPSTPRIYEHINNYFQVSDKLDLYFNINSHESENNRKDIFKPIAQISLGQKVVALLDFIFIFKDIINDPTPLLLDQPEDNLDSSYIYKHLVHSLRKQKDNRQVIIVTHNSTIVTNSKPEQIITMQSDNLNGWVKNNGYPTEREIVRDIINLLEGGIESFKHKQFIYKNILEE